MDGVLNFDKWNNRLNEQVDTKPITYASLKTTPVDNKAIHDAQIMAQNSTQYGKPGRVEKLWKYFPELGSALIAKEKIKNLYDYYDKAGAYQVVDSTMTGAGTKYLYSFEGQVIFLNENGKTPKLEYKSKDEFIKWYNAENLAIWKTGKNPMQLGYIATNQWVSHGIHIVTGKKLANPKNAIYQGAAPLFTYEIKGKHFGTYAYFKGKSIKEWEGGDTLYAMLDEVYKFDDLKIHRSLKRTDIPYMKVMYQGKIMTELNRLQGFYFDETKPERTKAAWLTGDKTDVKTDTEVKVHPDKTWKKPGAFKTGEFKVEDSPTAQDFIENVIQEIEKYKEGKTSVTIGSLSVTSSASNFYGSAIPATHSNDGKKLDGTDKKSGDPFPDNDSYKELSGEDANNKLAYLRGSGFAAYLKEEIAKLEGVKVTGDIKVFWRVTETGGKVDAKRDKTKYPNAGQYVKVMIKAGSKSVEVTTTETQILGVKGNVTLTNMNKLEYSYGKAPGLLKAHPNAKFSGMINAISDLLGMSRTKTTSTQYANKKGAGNL
jgi:hypothetical protein